MRSSLIMVAALVLPMAAHAGCVTGAIVGGVAGHLAGGHGLLGAGAGCVAGHEYSKHQAAKVPQQGAPSSANNQSGPAPSSSND